MIKIEIENNVFCFVHKKDISKETKQIIWDALSFDVEIYLNKKDRNGKKKHIKNKASFFNKRTGVFYVGFLKIIKRELRNKNIEFKIVPKEKLSKIPKIKQFSWAEERAYQIRTLKKCLKVKRCLIDSSTGSGKTLIFNTIINTLDANTLILCEKKDIHEKNFGLAKEYFDDVVKITSKNDMSWKGHKIVFATPRVLNGIDPLEYVDYFDVLIFDEVHTLANIAENIVTSCNAQWRFGFTGSIPHKEFDRLKLIGLFGDIVKGIKREEEKEFLSEIKLTLKNPPYKFCNSERYEDIYRECVVENKGRNEMIIADAIERIEQGMSGLIMTNQYQQGYNLQEIAKSVGYNFAFINGKTDKLKELPELQKDLDNKTIHCIITNIWKEGIDITSLNFVIIAFGHKAPERLIQMVGRTTRKSKGKDYGEVIDYIDQQKYLGKHTLERIQIYIQEGWL